MPRTSIEDPYPKPDLADMRQAPPHPGAILLKAFIEPQGHGFQAKAARAMGMSTIRFNQILSGKRSLTPESAVLIGELTHTSPIMWLHMQADHDLWHALHAFASASTAVHASIRRVATVFECVKPGKQLVEEKRR